eukprot:GDKJ01001771.1.p1 GENE.GDKJ01001771.1~~GDKJ01001771.1.p1  ORF type:complete len:340 (-),score=94.89 GDKJ01001771.1:32-1051(-)
MMVDDLRGRSQSLLLDIKKHNNMKKGFNKENDSDAVLKIKPSAEPEKTPLHLKDKPVEVEVDQEEEVEHHPFYSSSGAFYSSFNKPPPPVPKPKKKKAPKVVEDSSHIPIISDEISKEQKEFIDREKLVIATLSKQQKPLNEENEKDAKDQRLTDKDDAKITIQGITINDFGLKFLQEAWKAPSCAEAMASSADISRPTFDPRGDARVRHRGGVGVLSHLAGGRQKEPTETQTNASDLTVDKAQSDKRISPEWDLLKWHFPPNSIKPSPANNTSNFETLIMNRERISRVATTGILIPRVVAWRGVEEEEKKRAGRLTKIQRSAMAGDTRPRSKRNIYDE